MTTAEIGGDVEPVTSILVADDHAVLREAIAGWLANEESFVVAGTAASAEEAVELVEQHRPDIVLLDIEMPGLSSFDAAERIMKIHPDTRIIFLSGFTNDCYIEEALRIGAMGFLTKTETPARIIAAIKEVAANRACFSADIERRIVFESGSARLASGRTRASSLTRRELQVLRYVSRGLSKKEIAPLLNVSVKTVEKHTEHLMGKLDIHDRVALTRFAIREGIVGP